MLTGLFFFLQEYNMFIISGLRSVFFLPNPLLCSVRCVHLRGRADAAIMNRLFPQSARAESASLHVISEIWLLLQCAAALQCTLYEADALDHALAQMRPHQILIRTL